MACQSWCLLLTNWSLSSKGVSCRQLGSSCQSPTGNGSTSAEAPRLFLQIIFRFFTNTPSFPMPCCRVPRRCQTMVQVMRHTIRLVESNLSTTPPITATLHRNPAWSRLRSMTSSLTARSFLLLDWVTTPVKSISNVDYIPL